MFIATKLRGPRADTSADSFVSSRISGANNLLTTMQLFTTTLVVAPIY